jgi:hypothetical protein
MPPIWASGDTWRDETGLVGAHHELGAIARLQFHQQTRNMRLAGRRAHERDLGDLRIRVTASDEHQYFALAVSEDVERCGRNARAARLDVLGAIATQ